MNFGCLLERSSSLLFQLNKNVKSSLNYACQTLWIELLSKSAFSQKTKLWNVSHKQNISDAISTTRVISWTFEVTVRTGLHPGCVFLTYSIFWREAGKEQEAFKISSFLMISQKAVFSGFLVSARKYREMYNYFIKACEFLFPVCFFFFFSVIFSLVLS